MAKEEEKEQEDTEKKGGLSTVKIIIISVVLSGLIGGGLVGGTFYFVSSMNAEATDASAAADVESGETEPPVEPAKPPKYHSMDPKFIVSFSDQKGARFMQFSLEVMTRNDDVIMQLDEHMPVIRSSLLMLFGGQKYEVMATREGKQKLLEEAREDINNSLKMLAGGKEQVAVIEAVYFNSFVIQ